MDRVFLAIIASGLIVLITAAALIVFGGAAPAALSTRASPASRQDTLWTAPGKLQAVAAANQSRRADKGLRGSLFRADWEE